MTRPLTTEQLGQNISHVEVGERIRLSSSELLATLFSSESIRLAYREIVQYQNERSHRITSGLVIPEFGNRTLDQLYAELEEEEAIHIHFDYSALQPEMFVEALGMTLEDVASILDELNLQVTPNLKDFDMSGYIIIALWVSAGESGSSLFSFAVSQEQIVRAKQLIGSKLSKQHES